MILPYQQALNLEIDVYIWSIVPFGMATAGSFKSPDKLAPATIPVTAGKNTPKTEKKLGAFSGFL